MLNTLAMPHTEPLPRFVRDFSYPRYMLRTGWGRMHYVDTGGAHRPVLMVHGNPTWSYLYRKVMRELSGEPLRLVAPDLIGLGLSDKPRDWREHSVKRHGETLLEFVEKLGLRDIVLVVQDWGGPIGAWMAAHAGGRVTAALIMNTSVLLPNQFRTTPFHRFSHMPVVSDLAFRALRFPIPVMNSVQGDKRSIDAESIQAYKWPLRKFGERAAPLALARMVPNAPDHPTVAELVTTDAWLRGFEGPVELLWGVRDPILGRTLKKHREMVPHARVTETQAGHFLQEEVPDEIAGAVRRLVRS